MPCAGVAARLFDKDMMFPVKEGIFEGQKAMIPNKCSDYLIWHYGDEWSYMPPHDSREGHVAVCVDELPYQELREEYMPNIHKGRLRRDSVFRKFYNMLIAKKNHKVRQEGLAMKARAVALDLQGAISESGLKISELVETRSFHRLNALFGSYYKSQLSADFIGREDYTNIYAFYHPILVGVPDEVFYAAMLTLFYTERVSKAYRMLQIRQQSDHITPEMEKLKEDIELFRKAADYYEFHRMEEAQQIIEDLLNRYPGHPGFMKFRCRFLMENAGENRIEAERFIDKALKKFPEDGYFLKYKADIFWMNGEVQKAAELYLQVKSKTTNGVVWLEMDRFFRGYKAEILKNCEELLAARRKKEALSLMELWNQLIPEDDDIQGAFYLAKVACARTQSEIEQEINEIRRVIEIPMLAPVKEKTNKNKKSEEHQMYKKALTRAWKRLGYSKELAALRTQIICTGEESELEWLAEQVRNRQFRKEEKACVYKLVGDVRMKQGQTREAFANYKKALEYEMSSYVKTELYRIFINDLNDGSRQAKSFAKKADITVVLDNWLDKYGSIEDVKRIVQSVM
jgi:predicted Zn-dependent protease